MSEKQPNALRLADELNNGCVNLRTVMNPAATELRRLHGVNVELLAMLQKIADSGDWYCSALEFNHNVDGNELEIELLALIAKATKSQE